MNRGLRSSGQIHGSSVKTESTPLKGIYIVGAVATLVAALIFRRNLAAELSIFILQPAPTTAADWFTLLQNNSLLGMSLLNVFDVINYILLAVMFAALYFALRQTNRNWALSAAFVGFVGIAIYLVSNSAFSMISLSSQYANAATESQRAAALAMGQTILANGDPGAIYEGNGGCVSLALIAVAGLLFSIVMLRGRVFHIVTAYVGIAACVLDLAYIIGLAFVPLSAVSVLSASCLATAGFLLLLWHLLIGVKLYQLSKTIQLKEAITHE